ncbi:MAG TPA: right-handed parallel beta-helix repeat-containing protein [Gaiellaceae bacterium]|nr:right-handed parallel beta-helix repeat-containing protein [Gaiellaceae bacterium]
MKRLWLTALGALAALACLGGTASASTLLNEASAASCTPTGLMRDGNNLTAAVYNPQRAVTGTVDATGCNIGVYFAPSSHGRVLHANVFGANYFGVVNNGGDVTVRSSQIHDIGEHPLNGTQHGIAVAFVRDSGQPSTGSVSQNGITHYQKGGIVLSGPNTTGKITGNEVLGEGPVSYIAQNGIQVSAGAHAQVKNNTVNRNSYTGSGGASSAGILIFGGCGQELVTGTLVKGNSLDGNDVGIWAFDADPACANASPTPTNIKIERNHVSNNAVNNTSGWGPGEGYQAGIADFGNSDSILKNSVCGAGYTPTPGPNHLYYIDITGAIAPTVTGNITSATC